MAEDQPRAGTILPPGFASESLRTIYADGVANIQPFAGQVVKFYLFEVDPDQSGVASFRPRATTQIAMPLVSFLHTSAFFERAVKLFISQGIITQEVFDEVKKNENPG